MRGVAFSAFQILESRRGARLRDAAALFFALEEGRRE
jgi:hypothetical protein